MDEAGGEFPDDGKFLTLRHGILGRREPVEGSGQVPGPFRDHFLQSLVHLPQLGRVGVAFRQQADLPRDRAHPRKLLFLPNMSRPLRV